MRKNPITVHACEMIEFIMTSPNPRSGGAGVSPVIYLVEKTPWQGTGWKPALRKSHLLVLIL
jgi:hypothetical protein